MGEIKLFAGTFAPRGWAICDGRLLPIAQNQAIFSLLGTTYGGNGTTNFALPDLRGRVAVGTGQGRNLTNVQVGQTFGTENTTILNSNLPPHTHQLRCSSKFAGADNPTGRYFGASAGNAGFYDDTANSIMAQDSVSVVGSGQPINIQQPSLGMNYIIALEGIYPQRN